MAVGREEVALLRVVAQGLVPDGRPGDPATAVRHLLALQGQDLPGALRSVALRCGQDVAAVAEAFDDGRLVRTWPMRGTLHVVVPADLRWLLSLTVRSQHARARRRHAELGLDERTVALALDVAREASGEGPGPTREELLERWGAAGIATGEQRGYHLVGYLCQAAELVWGATVRGADGRVVGQRLQPVDARFPVADATREELLARLAERYLRSHGPATVADLARWTGLGLREVRAAAAAVRDRLAVVEVDGVEHLMDPGTPDRLAARREEARRRLLLPGFDELLLGYADRGATLAAEHLARVVPGRNGVFRPTVVRDGRVVGTWRPATKARAQALELFETPGGAAP